MGVTPISVPQGIANSLVSAGDKSGVDFNYLLQTAMRESSLNPHAKAGSSSAVGLFQFLESTWLEVMKSDGPRLGYQKYADAITEQDGEYVIKDQTLRAEVLKLREDPQVSADLAAAFTRNNGAYLQQRFGRMPSAGELYIAHFLGARGAATLFSAGLKDPDQSAAKLFPKQAKANPSIFYEHGRARSVKQVYKALVAQHLQLPGIDPAFAAQQIASEPTQATAAAKPTDMPFDPLPAPAPLEVPATLSPTVPVVPVAANPTASDPRWPQEIVPSRIGPGDVSFTSLFSTDVAVTPRRLLSQPEEPVAGAGFFTQLYAQ